MRLVPALLVASIVAGAPVLAASPASADSRELILAGIKLHEAGAYDDAIALYRRVLEADPTNVDARYEMAFSTFGKGDYLAAVEMLDRVVASPETAPPGAWLLLGSAHGMLGHWALAASSFRSGLAFRPNDPALRFHLALALSAQGRFEPAIDEFEACLRDSPYHAEIWRAFGDTLYDAGDKGRAFAAYARSLTLDGDTPPSEEIAKKMWEMIFEDTWTSPGSTRPGERRAIRVRVPGGTRRSSPVAAEAAGMSMIAVLRDHEPWKHKSDAAFFAYALDTMLTLVSSFHARESADPFWGPFVLAYFDAMRASGHMEALAYDIRRTAGDPDALRWGEDNLAKLDAFRRSSDRWTVDRTGAEPGADPR